jgi:hypothetical protein
MGKEFGALDLVQGPRPLDVKGGNAQVAVVLQGQGDHLPQVRIDKELLPGDFGNGLFSGSRLCLLISRAVWP